MVWHNVNLITSQSRCDILHNLNFSSCPISAYKFQEIGIDSMFVPMNVMINYSKIMVKKFTMCYILEEKKKRSDVH